MRYAGLEARIAELAVMHGLTAVEADVVRKVATRGHLSTVTPDLYAPRIASALRALASSVLKAPSVAMVGGDVPRSQSPSERAERFIRSQLGVSGSSVGAAFGVLGLADANLAFMSRRLELADPGASPDKWAAFRSAVFGGVPPQDWNTAMAWLSNPEHAPPISWQGLLAWIRDNPVPRGP